MNGRGVVRVVVLTIWFATTCALYGGFGGNTWASPDENSLATFARTFATTGTFQIPEPGNSVGEPVIGPRSAVAVGAVLTPGGFLGLPVLAGAATVIFGNGILPLLTPVLALLCVFFLWDIMRVCWKDETLADIAAALLLLLPAFWYYSARALMPNVPFVTFLALAVWAAAAARMRGWWGGVLCGAALGTALAIRLVEAPWVLVAAGVLLLVHRERLGRAFLAGAAAGLLLLLAGLAAVQWATYGYPFATGYTVGGFPSAPISAEEELARAATWFIPSTLFPFGVHPRAILRNVAWYGVALFPWVAAFTLVGVAAVRKELRRPGVWRTTLILFLTIGTWLAILYGSWRFHDNPDPSLITIGNSYVRYWLPVFLLALPFMAAAVRACTPRWRIVTLCAVALVSARLVFFGHDGILPTRHALEESAEKRIIVLENTQENAIIIVDRADKFLFPHRRVVQPLREESTYRALPLLAQTDPLYYFGITLPPVDVEFFQRERLDPHGLTFAPVVTVENETLYRIFAKNAILDQ